MSLPLLKSARQTGSEVQTPLRLPKHINRMCFNNLNAERKIKRGKRTLSTLNAQIHKGYWRQSCCQRGRLDYIKLIKNKFSECRSTQFGHLHNSTKICLSQHLAVYSLKNQTSNRLISPIFTNPPSSKITQPCQGCVTSLTSSSFFVRQIG